VARQQTRARPDTRRPTRAPGWVLGTPPPPRLSHGFYAARARFIARRGETERNVAIPRDPHEGRPSAITPKMEQENTNPHGHQRDATKQIRTPEHQRDTTRFNPVTLFVGVAGRQRHPGDEYREVQERPHTSTGTDSKAGSEELLAVTRHAEPLARRHLLRAEAAPGSRPSRFKATHSRCGWNQPAWNGKLPNRGAATGVTTGQTRTSLDGFSWGPKPGPPLGAHFGRSLRRKFSPWLIT